MNYFKKNYLDKFCNEDHEEMFWNICARMGIKDHRLDCYHLAAAYLLSLDTECRKHINDLYDFKEDCIKPAGLDKAWQTGTSRKTTRLAFNLYTGHTDWGDDDESKRCTPSDIFCSEYAPYYWEAVKVRYPEYCGIDE